jgi:hypothetical protein
MVIRHMAKISYYGNPYTHEEHSVETLNNKDGSQSCDWCGSKPKKLHIYDGLKGKFCDKGCCESYHG